MRWSFLLAGLILTAGCIDPGAEPDTTMDEAEPVKPMHEQIRNSSRQVDVFLEVHVPPEAHCTAGLCIGGGIHWPEHRVRPNETITAGSLTFDVVDPAPWVESYSWRVSCADGPRDCLIAEHQGMPPFVTDVGPLDRATGIRHEFLAHGPQGSAALLLLDNEATITGSLTVIGVPAPPPELVPQAVSFEGNGPQCAPTADPSCGVIGSGSIHVLSESGRPYRTTLQMVWADPTAPELTLTLKCSTPGSGQCPQLNKEVRGPSPLNVTWDLWPFPANERLLLQVYQLEGSPVIEMGTRPAYSIEGTIWKMETGSRS